ncbi:hypothetical protein [Noviherbaspirillum galbum]|uniref:Lipoprotein n=1 Tax=Noviherbaspirillum galbum TaxID=2709383 RepID=A0A6B3SRX2_9BURK|nr:hypothetical protein [Noviherbaspirillum galbum]NEX61536.1 hypothetical protein [Noviherbaspirillum galbum]
MTSKQWMAVMAAGMGLALAGCGGGSSSVATGLPDAATSGGAANAPMDVYTKSVAQLVSSSSDSAEPMALDANPASMPDDLEPVPVS